MAITDVKEYAHLTDADIEALGHELDAIRRDIEASRGERDARYVKNTIRLQRSLDFGGRAAGNFDEPGFGFFDINRSLFGNDGLSAGDVALCFNRPDRRKCALDRCAGLPRGTVWSLYR